MRVRHWHLALTSCFLVSFLASSQAEVETVPDETPPIVSLCDVLSQPSAYAHKPITISVHIAPTKEGSLLRNPACSKLWVKLYIDGEATAENGLSELREVLHRPSPDIVATLTGVYDPDYFDDIQHSKYPVFRVLAAKDIKRSTKAQSRGASSPLRLIR